MSEPLLQLRELGKSYILGRTVVEVFTGLEAEFYPGELVTIQGASGTGKSTLLQIIGGLDQPNAGEVRWLGESIHRWSRQRLSEWRRDQVGLVFQSYQLLPELSAFENVELPGMIAGKSAPGRAEELLQRVGLTARREHRPSELSGGEQQRVAIARALRNQPRVILADEPTGNLDRATGERVMALLIELCRESGATLILVTHDPQLASLGDRQLILSSGRLGAAGC